ncbi:hypothetical protein JAAARDRAFT_28921 [Jaapia argillacea MUCL 33604]|uniref:Uncharacterized protein n=1 Tax=Jaapia argillacea MUCL 33604 TaxID=933084 RepID=A0A067Q9Z1_9AGAM|nr:hypothetical protein JAAARDRAFT_28921 [Jaapia argillacea MUCL 33604]
MLVIHGAFSYPTVEGYLPDPFFRVYLDRIHRAKHGSDSGSYDNDGEFVSDKFEEFFEKYSSLYEKDGLTIWDTMRGIVGQRCVFDVFGWGAAMFEWIPTWVMVWPKDGVLRKEDVRGVYDGSIFWKVAKARGVDLGREGVDM